MKNLGQIIEHVIFMQDMTGAESNDPFGSVRGVINQFTRVNVVTVDDLFQDEIVIHYADFEAYSGDLSTPVDPDKLVIKKQWLSKSTGKAVDEPEWAKNRSFKEPE